MENLLKLIEEIFDDHNGKIHCYEICIYSGTFYPFHLGHQELLKKLPEDLITFFVPDNNPQKTKESKRNVNYYKTLVQFGRNQHPYYEMLNSKDKNYTFHYIYQLQQKFPFIKFSLAMGMDSLMTLSTWFESTNLIKMIFRIYVLSREEKLETKIFHFRQLKKINPELEIIELGHHLFENLASSKILK